MRILGIETSCDECSVAVLEDGKSILSNVVVSQIERHAPWNGVVPEIASRLHVEWIDAVMERSLEEAGISFSGIDGIAVTCRPGLAGSLLVGLSYAKGLAWAGKKKLIGVDHIVAHQFAAHLQYEIEFPYIGLVVSGGHTIITLVDSFDSFSILGTTIDDACGEAFDKVAKHYDMGYPGGVAIDNLAETGDEGAFDFPYSSLDNENHRYDVSYSGLKNAVINQLDRFRLKKAGKTDSLTDIVASFRRVAIGMLMKKLYCVIGDTGINRVVLGGGVAANKYLRRMLAEDKSITSYFPDISLCTDNGAMIAFVGNHLLESSQESALDLNVMPRVSKFRHRPV